MESPLNLRIKRPRLAKLVLQHRQLPGLYSVLHEDDWYLPMETGNDQFLGIMNDGKLDQFSRAHSHRKIQECQLV